MLAILAPVASVRLNDATDTAILQGASLILDAQLDPLKKLKLAPGLLAGRRRLQPPRRAARRGGRAPQGLPRPRRLRPARGPAGRRGGRRDRERLPRLLPDRRRARPDRRGAADQRLATAGDLARRGRGGGSGGRLRGRARRREAAAGDARRSLPGARPAEHRRDRGRDPGAGAQAAGPAACKLHVAREELALAIFDADRAKTFEEDHGVDPRSTISLLSLLGGG